MFELLAVIIGRCGPRLQTPGEQKNNARYRVHESYASLFLLNKNDPNSVCMLLDFISGHLNIIKWSNIIYCLFDFYIKFIDSR